MKNDLALSKSQRIARTANRAGIVVGALGSVLPAFLAVVVLSEDSNLMGAAAIGLAAAVAVFGGLWGLCVAVGWVIRGMVADE